MIVLSQMQFMNEVWIATFTKIPGWWEIERPRGGGGGGRHQQEHRPQRPTESSDPTQHADGRAGDRPGPRKGATTRRNVTQGGGGGLEPPKNLRWGGVGKRGTKGCKANSSRCVPHKGSEGQGSVRTAVHPSPRQHGKGGGTQKGAPLAACPWSPPSKGEGSGKEAPPGDFQSSPSPSGNLQGLCPCCILHPLQMPQEWHNTKGRLLMSKFLCGAGQVTGHNSLPDTPLVSGRTADFR